MSSKKLFSAVVLNIFLVSFLSAANLIPLKVKTQIHDLNKVRTAISGGFMDIVQSPTVVNEFDYMEIRLEPNGFITLEEHRCAITFNETIEGLEIQATPFDLIDGRKVEVTDFSTRKGVYMMIEGAAQELDYEDQMRPQISPELGGFLSFNDTIKLATERLEGGQLPPRISFANYPSQGRTYQLLTPNSTGMVQIEEDPTRPNQTLRYWVVQATPQSGVSGAVKSDIRATKDWLKATRKYILNKDGEDIRDLFFEQSNAAFSTRYFDVSLQSEATGGSTNKSLLIQENASARASKASY